MVLLNKVLEVEIFFLSVFQIFFGVVVVGFIVFVLYKFIVIVEGSFIGKVVFMNYFICNLIIIVCIIVMGLCYLVIFVFVVNFFGFILFFFQLVFGIGGFEDIKFKISDFELDLEKKLDDEFL